MYLQHKFKKMEDRMGMELESIQYIFLGSGEFAAQVSVSSTVKNKACSSYESINRTFKSFGKKQSVARETEVYEIPDLKNQQSDRRTSRERDLPKEQARFKPRKIKKD